MQGLITEDSLKKSILDRFINKFVKNDYTFRDPKTGGRKLMWCNLKGEYKIYSTEELFKSQLHFDVSVCFYDEFTEEMYLTDFEDIRNFINSFEPWDEVDAEIFDEDLNWLIAVTHEDVSLVYGIDITIDEYDYEKDMANGGNY